MGLNLESSTYESISGPIAFIRIILNMTPSVKLEKLLIRRVNNPKPSPYIILPVSVYGEDTGSVAIKNAPYNKPPVKTWYTGAVTAPGIIACPIADRISTVEI